MYHYPEMYLNRIGQIVAEAVVVMYRTHHTAANILLGKLLLRNGLEVNWATDNVDGIEISFLTPRADCFGWYPAVNRSNIAFIVNE